MRDRQLFDHWQLSNGISVYHYPDDTPLTEVMVQVPVGSAHNNGLVLPGTFHFLEHMLFNRCEKFPEYQDFFHQIRLRAGNINAATGPFLTNVELQIPSKHFDWAQAALFSFLFEPIFDKEDLNIECSVVTNERRSRERWFPGHDEIDHYLSTQVLWDCPLTLRQSLGDEADLAALDASTLHAAHQAYFDPRLRVMIGGSGDATPLLEKIGALHVQAHQLPPQWESVRWVNSQYHEKSFRDCSCPELLAGGIMVESVDPQSVAALEFILNYLTNPIIGPLYRWLRAEKGWAYGIRYRVEDFFGKHLQWVLQFPVNSVKQVREIRQELPGHIEAALADENAINLEINMTCDHDEAYAYRTLEPIMADAENNLACYGRIIPEKEQNEWLEQWRDPKVLQQVWREFTQPGRTGGVCLLPE